MTATEKDIRNEADIRIFGEWIAEGSRVLDLGCGRGVLLDHLARRRRVFGVGVDNDPEKISACLERGVNAVQGDMLAVLRAMPDASFDRVVCSRVLQDLADPAEVVLQAMRVGRHGGRLGSKVTMRGMDDYASVEGGRRTIGGWHTVRLGIHRRAGLFDDPVDVGKLAESRKHLFDAGPVPRTAEEKRHPL